MTIFAWIAIGLLIAKVVLMLDRRVPSDIIGLGIIGMLLVTGTLSTDDALSCFSNESVVLVGALSIVVAGLIYSGSIQWLIEHLYAKSTSLRGLMRRLMIPAAVMSVMMVADAVVIIYVHIVRVVGKRVKVAPSKVLLPVGMAAALGSMCSLLGAPSNLIIANFYRQSTHETMGVFDPFLTGFACAVVGIIVVMQLRRWLPERKSPQDAFSESSDYTVELLVPTDSKVVGETVSDCGLHNVNGGHLIEIVRFDHEVISPVPEDEFLLGGDRLVYTGQVNSILNLRKTHGLVNATHHVFSVSEINDERHLQVASVNVDSSLVGCRMIDTDFEKTYGVVLVAISRQGQRMDGLPREVVLSVGDTLLFEGAKLHPQQLRNELSFFDSELFPPNASKAVFSTAILMLLLLLSTADIMPLLHASVLAAMLMVVFRCCNFTQVQNALNWKLLMVFAGSVCLGKSLDATGVATIIGEGVNHLCGDSAMISLIVIATITTIVTEFMGNPLCAAIFAPIAIHTAQMLGANPMTFCITVLISTNAAFLTPVSSNPNILIYGPGGYRFTDFLKVGIPLKLAVLATNIIIVNIVYPMY